MRSLDSLPSYRMQAGPQTDTLAEELYPDLFTTTSPPITDSFPVTGKKKAGSARTSDRPALTADDTASPSERIITEPLSHNRHSRKLTKARLMPTGRPTDRLTVRLTGRLTTEPLQPDIGPIADVATTQSLVAALQATMPVPVRKPVIIPGSRNKQQKRTGQSEGRRERRLPAHIRGTVALSMLLLFLLASLFTLTPLGAGQSGIPLVDGLVSSVRSLEQGMGLVQHANPDANKATTNQPTNLPPMTLPKSQYVAIARQSAIDAGIPPEYFVRQINAESGFNPNAVSPAGAVGIAQFLPSTAAGLGINPYDPVAALKGAAQYMARLYKQYGGDYAKALAAYNAGSGNVNRAIQIGGANWMNYIPAETRNYIRIVMGI